MSIRRLVATFTMATLLVACGPEDGRSNGSRNNGGPPPPPANGPAAGEVLGREYRVQLNGMNSAREKIRRSVNCLIDARNAQGQTVYVTDARTGATTPARQNVRVNSQNRLRIQVWANVHTIIVECTMLYGKVGESLSCEFLDSRGGHAALRNNHVEFGIVEEAGDEPICFGIILVNA